MRRNRIHVLIVEDDRTQGKALLEAFTRVGYQAVWKESSVLGLTQTQRQEFQVLIIDCMLPKMNGVDLAEAISQQMKNKPKIFLLSGIFKDKNFIRDAVDRTGALMFFDKPFDIQQLLAQVDNSVREELENQAPPLLDLYATHPPQGEALMSLLEQESPVSYIHLPKILKVIQNSNLTGDLTLTNAGGDSSLLALWQGKIFAVRSSDKDSFFGSLAVSLGFVSVDDVIAALNNPAQKLIGKKLIDSLSISPHAIHVIMEEQLALRLSQTIQPGMITLQWEPKAYKTPETALNPLRIEQLALDWVESKISFEEIRTHLHLWGSYLLEGPFQAPNSDALTIDQFFSQPGAKDRDDTIYLFRELIRGNASLGQKGEVVEDFEFLDDRLDKMLKVYKEQNLFQILGVSEKAKSLELNKAFEELREHFDPANLPASCPQPTVVKCTRVFQYIEKAYRTLSDEVERNQYVLTLQSKKSQDLLEHEPLFRAAILELQNGHLKSAAQKFQTLVDRKLYFKDLRAYRIWAGLKIDRNYREITFDHIPPEERHSAPYMMAKGIYHRSRRQYKKALEAFRTAHVLDSSLVAARKETQKVMADIEKRKAMNKTVVDDVTNVVGNFFSKIGGRKGA